MTQAVKLVENDLNEHSDDHKVSKNASYVDLFDRLKDGIMLLDTTTLRPKELNMACLELFSCTGDQIDNISLLDMIDPKDKDQLQKHLSSLVRRYYTKTWRTKFLFGEEWKHFDLSMGSLDLSNQERVIQIIFNDITENVRLQEELERISITDKLTGMYNRRFFDSKMKEEMERAIRTKAPFSLIMIDIDHFKKYNDRNGHPAGDALLQEFTLEVKNRIRGLDYACRYGGEEFAIVCPNTSLQDAVVVAERIREFVSKKKFENGEHQPLGFISASIGISNFPINFDVEWKDMNYLEKTAFLDKCIASMKEKSDNALYVAKDQGRNRVVAAN